jgi:hypothetical protein
MMILSMVGAVRLGLGRFCGGVLVAVPLGLAALRGPVLAVSVALLALALAAAAGRVLGAAAVLQTAGSPMPLWYVLGVAGLLGTLGAAASAREAG